MSAAVLAGVCAGSAHAAAVFGQICYSIRDTERTAGARE